MTLSKRARAFLGTSEDIFAVMASDPWSPENPDGYINLGTAENHLVFDLLEPRLTAARRIVAEDTHYQELAGSPSFRSSLAQFLATQRGVEVDPDDLVVVAGAGVALEFLAYILCDPGDGIVVPAPYFGGVDAALSGRSAARIIPAPLDPAEGFALTAEAVERAILQARGRGVPLRAVALLSPSNPLGQVYDEPTLRAVAEVTVGQGLQLIADEIYAGSVYDGPFVSTGRLVPSVVSADRLHLAWGFAKDFGLSGYKVGVLHTRDPQVRAVAQKLARFGSVSSETQVLLRDLLADHAWTEGFLAESRARLGAAYESTVKALDGHGLAYLPAGAGLFVWLDLRAELPEPTFEAETALARRIFTEAKLNLAPGGTFHCPEPGWFRLCFATTPDSVTQATQRLARLFARS